MEGNAVADTKKRLRLKTPISILWWNPTTKTFRIEDTLFVGDPYKTIYQANPPRRICWSDKGEEMLAYACQGKDGVTVGENRHTPQNEFYRWLNKLEHKYRVEEIIDNVIRVNFRS